MAAKWGRAGREESRPRVDGGRGDDLMKAAPAPGLLREALELLSMFRELAFVSHGA